jgi:hypothetical protein
MKEAASRALHGVTNQKTVLVIVTTVRTPNLKSTRISSYIVGSHFASMVESVRISEMWENT